VSLCIGDLSRCWLSDVRQFGLIAPKDFKIIYDDRNMANLDLQINVFLWAFPAE
jgi:hypothetical protein